MITLKYIIDFIAVVLAGAVERVSSAYEGEVMAKFAYCDALDGTHRTGPELPKQDLGCKVSYCKLGNRLKCNII